MENLNSMTSQTSQKSKQVISRMGEKMNSLANTLRQKSPESGRMSSVATNIADKLRSSGSYLQDHDLQAIKKDINEVVKRHPMQSLGIGLGVGFLTALLLKRR